VLDETSTDLVELDLLASRFVLECADPALRAELRHTWDRCRPVGPPVGRVHRIKHDDVEALKGPNRGNAVATHLTVRAIEVSASKRLTFHASGIADPAGRVVALVGRSGAGKSTAAARLAALGWGYVSDEVVSVDDDARVVPFARPVLLEPADPTTLGKVAHSPDDLGLGRCPDDLTLGRLVVLDRQRSVAEPSVERLGLLDGVLELIPQISALARRANPLQRLCRLIERCGGVYRVTYSEAEQLGPTLTELLDTEPGPIERWEPAHMPISRAWGLMDARVRRPPHRDAIVTDEEYLVLDDRVPVRLAGIGATIWESCDDAPTIAELTDRIVEAHGSHPDASRMVSDAVTTMVEGHVLGWARPRPLDQVRVSIGRLGPSSVAGAP
jgi:hypothetical protein